VTFKIDNILMIGIIDIIIVIFLSLITICISATCNRSALHYFYPL